MSANETAQSSDTLFTAVYDPLKAMAGKQLLAAGGRSPSQLARERRSSRKAGGLLYREIDVLRLIAEGCSNKRVGERLHLSEDTVKRRRPLGSAGTRERAQRIRARLEVRSNPGAGTEVELRVPSSAAYRRLRRSSCVR